MDGAPTKVLGLFRVVQRPTRILGSPLVACIGAGRSEPTAQVAGEALVADGAGKPTIAHAQKAMVPTLLRQPHLKMDIGIRAGPKHSGHAAKHGQVV